MSDDWTPIDYRLDAEIMTDDEAGSWHYVVMENSAERFGQAKATKVKGTVDDLPYEGTMLPKGGGTHLMAIRADARMKLKKGAGDTVSVAISAFK